MPINIRRRIGHKWENARQRKIALRLQPLEAAPNKIIKSVAIIGLFSAPTGLGNAAILFENELIESGYKTKQIDCVKIFCSKEYRYEIRDNGFENIDAVIFAINPDVAINIIDKIDIKNLLGKKIIGYWVWELEVPPPQWSIMKDFVHEVWTPSEFSANALRKIFHHPIKIVNHPVALSKTEMPNNDARFLTREKLGIKQDAFVAFQSIAFSSSMERKNTIEAIEIFLEAFEDFDDAYFIVRYIGEEHYPNSLKLLKRAANKGNGKIIIVKSSAEQSELFDFYAASDLYVSLHRSEGFGLNIAEAMLVGLPVIATAWSGNMEFCNDNVCILADCTMIPINDVEKIYHGLNANWAKPIKSIVITKLHEFYKNPSYRLQLADNAKKEIKNKLSAKKLIL